MKLVVTITVLCALSFSTPALGQPALPTGVIGVGNFSHIVENIDRSIEFYRDVIGFQMTTPPRPFDGNPAIMQMGNTIGAQSRFAVLSAPGSALGVELIEYKDIDRTPVQPRFQDPGAANLIVRVRDIDSIMARLKKANARVLTAAGGPVEIGGGRSRNVFVQDPDGFIIELAQPNPVPAATGQSSGNIISTAFEVTVQNANRAASFYRDLLGFDPSPVAAFNADKLLTDTAGTPGAQFRQSRSQIPGTSVSMTFIEFANIDRKPLRSRVQDPGTAILQLMVADVDWILDKLKAVGATIVSVDGKPVVIGRGIRIAIVRDPDNLFLELIERR